MGGADGDGPRRYHEQKLLKKVDFLDWRRENNLHETAVVAKYGLSDREEYLKVRVNDASVG